MGSEKPPLIPRALEHRAVKERTPFLPSISCDIFRCGESSAASLCGHSCAHRRQEVQPPAATQEMPHQQPRGEAARDMQPHFVCEEGSTAPPVPSALPLLSPKMGPGSQPSWRSENCCWVLLTNQIQCQKNTRENYCSPGLSLRVYDTAVRSHSPYSTGAWTNVPSPSRTPTTLAHSSLLMLHMWGNGLRDILGAEPSPAAESADTAVAL